MKKRPLKSKRDSRGRFVSRKQGGKGGRKSNRQSRAASTRKTKPSKRQPSKPRRRPAPLPSGYKSPFGNFLLHPDDAPRHATWIALIRASFQELYGRKGARTTIPFKAPIDVDSQAKALDWVGSGKALEDFLTLSPAGVRATSAEVLGVFPMKGRKARQKTAKRVLKRKGKKNERKGNRKTRGKSLRKKR